MGSYAENQRITAVRKVYQRGVVNPMTNIEILWNQYTQFEQSVNPLIAKKMQEEKGRDYMNARRVTREYENMTKALSRNTPAVPPRNLPSEANQVELWKKYIQWEKMNPLHTEDQTLITKRGLRGAVTSRDVTNPFSRLCSDVCVRAVSAVSESSSGHLD